MIHTFLKWDLTLILHMLTNEPYEPLSSASPVRLKIFAAIQPLLVGPVTARSFLSFLELLGSAEKQVPSGRIHLRPLQVAIRSCFCIRVRQLDLPMSVLSNPSSIQALHWWSDLENLIKLQPLGPFKPDLKLYTNATLERWGAHDQHGSL